MRATSERKDGDGPRSIRCGPNVAFWKNLFVSANFGPILERYYGALTEGPGKRMP